MKNGREKNSKPIRFADELEWRLVVTFTRLHNQNETIKLRMSNRIMRFWDFKDALR